MNRKEIDNYFIWKEPENLNYTDFISELIIKWIWKIPNKGSFLIYANHPSTIDPILLEPFLKIRNDILVIMKKQNEKNFPIISSFQDKLVKSKNYTYTTNKKNILKHIKWWWWIIVVPTGTLDESIDTKNINFNEWAIWLAKRVDNILLAKINLEWEKIPYIKYSKWIIDISNINNKIPIEKNLQKIYK